MMMVTEMCYDSWGLIDVKVMVETNENIQNMRRVMMMISG
jgi:hypothetical protein